MTAILNSEIENTDRIKLYIDDVKQLSIKILPPEINYSELIFTIEEKQIRYGLSAIKGVGISAGSVITDERKQNGRYKSFFDFLKRLNSTKINKQTVEKLIKASAFDEFGVSAEVLLKAYPQMEEIIEANNRLTFGGQGTFFQAAAEGSGADEEEHRAVDKIIAAHQKEEEAEVLKEMEREALGFYLKYDPVAKYYSSFRKVASFDPALKKEWLNGAEAQLAGIIEKTKEIETKKSGAPMAFLSLETGRGSVEIVVFPSLFAKITGITAAAPPPKNRFHSKSREQEKNQLTDPELIKEKTTVLIKGTLQNNEKGTALIANSIEHFNPENLPNKYCTKLNILFKNPQLTETELLKLRELLHSHYGSACSVFLHFPVSKNRRPIVVEAGKLRVDNTKELRRDLTTVSFISKCFVE